VRGPSLYAFKYIVEMYAFECFYYLPQVLR